MGSSGSPGPVQPGEIRIRRPMLAARRHGPIILIHRIIAAPPDKRDIGDLVTLEIADPRPGPGVGDSGASAPGEAPSRSAGGFVRQVHPRGRHADLAQPVARHGRVGRRIRELLQLPAKWWGGYYGWRWPHGLFNQIESTLIGGTNAYLVSGDSKYLELPRSVVQLIQQRSRVVDGRIEAPAATEITAGTTIGEISTAHHSCILLRPTTTSPRPAAGRCGPGRQGHSRRGLGATGQPASKRAPRGDPSGRRIRRARVHHGRPQTTDGQVGRNRIQVRLLPGAVGRLDGA